MLPRLWREIDARRRQHACQYREDTAAVEQPIDVDGIAALLRQLLGREGGETSLAVGAVNLANTPPPFAATADGLPYDTRVADPRGRMFYLRVSHAF